MEHETVKEYKVLVGDMLLGRTESYAEALTWVALHDGRCRPGAYARIVEVR